MTFKTMIMKANYGHQFNADSYIESVAYSKAGKAYARHGQIEADMVYQKYIRNGQRLWADLCRSLPWYEAEKWLRLQFGNEDTFNRPIQDVKKSSNSELKPGPECWAKSVIDDYKTIIKKVADFEHGTKSENNRQRMLKNALDNAYIFLSVEPDIYRAERHGKWLPKKEFKNMLRTLKEIISKYEVVSTSIAA